MHKIQQENLKRTPTDSLTVKKRIQHADPRKLGKGRKGALSNTEDSAHAEEGTHTQNTGSTQLREEDSSPEKGWTELDLALSLLLK